MQEGIRLNSVERYNAIKNILETRGHEKISNLAFELGVSERTIRRDIDNLSLTEPIYTQKGKYGGVFIMNTKGKKVFTQDESQVINKICLAYKKQKNGLLSEVESKILDNIMDKYIKITGNSQVQKRAF